MTLVLVLALVVVCIVTEGARVAQVVRQVGDEILLAMKEKQ